MKVNGGILHGSGHVRILADRAQLTADRIDMVLLTGDSQVKENVRAVGVRLSPPNYLPLFLTPRPHELTSVAGNRSER
jgi:hypothetical protein